MSLVLVFVFFMMMVQNLSLFCVEEILILFVCSERELGKKGWF